ncbi:hypothetical protein HY478_01555 [Candidatus Uhrbacteria bacterium]|nr:hypothetical protein [Candidatus Uhrbacteria bacterium]
MQNIIPYGSWIVLLLALSLWGGIAWGLSTVNSVHSEREAKRLEAEQAAVLQSAALRLHALARETKSEREKLEGVAHSDILEILNTVEAIARDSKIPIHIGEAVSEVGSDSSSPLRSASFVIGASGSFSDLLHVVSLLESLPIPSSIADVHLERLTELSKGAPQWRVVTRVRFFTTADISS